MKVTELYYLIENLRYILLSEHMYFPGISPFLSDRVTFTIVLWTVLHDCITVLFLIIKNLCILQCKTQQRFNYVDIVMGLITTATQCALSRYEQSFSRITTHIRLHIMCPCTNTAWPLFPRYTSYNSSMALFFLIVTQNPEVYI